MTTEIISEDNMLVSLFYGVQDVVARAVNSTIEVVKNVVYHGVNLAFDCYTLVSGGIDTVRNTLVQGLGTAASFVVWISMEIIQAFVAVVIIGVSLAVIAQLIPFVALIILVALVVDLGDQLFHKSAAMVAG